MVQMVLVQCNLVDNQYQQKSELLDCFTPNLLNVEPRNLVFLETYDAEIDEIIITCTDQTGRPLEKEDKVNLTLLINRNETLFYRIKSKKICQRI